MAICHVSVSSKMTITGLHMLETEFTSREELLQVNAGLICQLQGRLRAKRYRPQEGDVSKLGHINSLIEALKVQNEILANAELDEIKEEIAKLKGTK